MTSRWNLDWTNVQRHHSREERKFSADGIPLNDNQVIQDLDQAETLQVPGNGGGRRSPTPQNEGQYQERV